MYFTKILLIILIVWTTFFIFLYILSGNANKKRQYFVILRNKHFFLGYSYRNGFISDMPLLKFEYFGHDIKVICCTVTHYGLWDFP